MKVIFYFFFGMTILLIAFSCREHNSNAKTPEDLDKMEEVRELKKEAMEKAKERAGSNDREMNSDSIARDTSAK